MKRARLVSLLLCLLVLINVQFPVIADEERDRLFSNALDALQTPAETALSTGKLAMREGESIPVPWLCTQVIPYDQLDETHLPEPAGVFQSSDETVAVVSKDGMLTGLGQGETVISYVTDDGEQQLRVSVSDDNIPFGAQNYVYVLKREFYSVKRAKLPKYNQYAKWYYGKRKEVGWCSVFTIYCANASGNNPVKLKDAKDETEPILRFFREGQVGHQYDGFMDMGRFVSVPKPGYLVIYAEMKNGYRTTHIGSVTDVEDMGNGMYMVKTVEGNMSNTVKGYCYLYDSKLDNHLVGVEKGQKLKKNMQTVPVENQTDPLLQYELHTNHWSVFGFCATYE